MNWAALAPIILELLLKYGPEFAALIAGIFTSTTAPTQAQWDALVALSKNTARGNMLAALAAHVPPIDPASPEGQAFLALTPA